MAISPSLRQFKSSGVYRLEFDRSQVISIPSETIRLVIGFSKKGPFNTPVFVQDSNFFTSVFGDIDLALEKKGSFFHRSVLTCLQRGPVIVLNLLKLEDVDQSQFKRISTSATIDNISPTFAPVKNFFNTDKFWFTDPEALVTYANAQSAINKRLLNIANVGRKTISVFTRKSDILGFDVLAKDWFGVGKVPEYINENDYISDFMIDVIVVEGDFSNYSELAIDPIFGPYFDNTGLKKSFVDQFGVQRDGLTSFLALDQVNVLAVYTGSILPEFQDKNGENLYIEDVVNLETSRTGLLLGFDSEYLDDNPEKISADEIDLVGHTIESEEPGVLNFLSYYGGIIDELQYAGSTGVSSLVIAATAGQTDANALVSQSDAMIALGATPGSGPLFDTLTIYGPNSSIPSGFTPLFNNETDWNSYRNSFAVGRSFVQSEVGSGTASDVNFSEVSSVLYNPINDTLQLRIALGVAPGVTGPIGSTGDYMAIYNDSGITTSGGTETIHVIPRLNQIFGDGTDLYAFVDSNLYQDNLSGIITDGNRIDVDGNEVFNIVDFETFADNNFDSSSIGIITSENSVFITAPNPIFSKPINYLRASAFEDTNYDTQIDIAIQSEYLIKTLTGNINEAFVIWEDPNNPYENPTATIWLDNSENGPLGLDGFNGRIRNDQYLVKNFGGTATPTFLDPNTGKSRLTRIISVSEDLDPTSDYYKKIKVETNDPIFIRVSGADLQVERYSSVDNFITHYRPHTLRGYSLRPEQLPNGTGIRQNEILDVIYNSNLFDALSDREAIIFRYVVDSFEGVIEPSTKNRLSRLARNQKSSFALCNMPSVKQFRQSTNPLFKFDSTRSFDSRYIATGGNLDLNPSNIFSLPVISEGANYCGFYGPNLIIREANRNYSIPPAAHVSNLFIDKYNLALPYSIVAGPRRGVLTAPGLFGVEHPFDRKDLDNIEPFGYNAIVNKRGFGLTINANQTAQQTVKSALSQIHVRELIIYIQDGIEAILKNYRWETNTPQNRLEIKTLADNFLNQILSDGGVFAFENVMDTTNNTTDIIEADAGILDTYIEPVRGMGTLIHRTTILRPGVIQTGNFL